MTPRFFCPTLFEKETLETVRLSGPLRHYIGRVRRLKQGETIVFFDGYGQEAVACISALSHKYIDVRVMERRTVPRERAIQLILWQAMPHAQTFDRILQKAVELGVSHIVPLATQHSQHYTDVSQEKKQEHWQAVMRSACEQCNRSHLPKLWPLCTLEYALSNHCAQTAQTTQHFLLYAHATQTFHTATIDSSAVITLVVGPEGDFSPTEIDTLIGRGCLPISMGPSILRVETAVTACLGYLTIRYG